MIEMNINVLVLVCIACVIIGFIIATFLSNAKINDLYDEITSKNKTINFYKNYVEGNTNKFVPTKSNEGNNK